MTRPSPRASLVGGLAAVGLLAVGIVAASSGPTDAAPAAAGPSTSVSSSSLESPTSRPPVAPETSGPTEPVVTTPPAPPPTPAASPGSALAAVAALAVKGRAPQTGYDRAQFGPAWADVDHNGCDTRVICTVVSAPVDGTRPWGGSGASGVVGTEQGTCGTTRVGV